MSAMAAIATHAAWMMQMMSRNSAARWPRGGRRKFFFKEIVGKNKCKFKKLKMTIDIT